MIQEWKDLDQIHPHDADVQQNHEDLSHPFWSAHRESAWLVGDQKRTTKPTLPSHLRHNIPNHLSRALSRLRLPGHNLNVERLRQQQHSS